jgi:hypothetical protein
MRRFGIAELECCSARLKAALELFPKRKESDLPEVCSCSIYV